MSDAHDDACVVESVVAFLPSSRRPRPRPAIVNVLLGPKTLASVWYCLVSSSRLLFALVDMGKTKTCFLHMVSELERFGEKFSR